jgi:hypothetical protein
MAKVKTFTSELKMFHTMNELVDLDKKVNAFFAENKNARIISASDTTTTDDKGATMGIIRVVTYEDGA